MGRKRQVEEIIRAYNNLLSKSGLNIRTILYSLSLLARLLEASNQDILDDAVIWAAAYIASHKPNNRIYAKNFDSFCAETDIDRRRLEEALQEYVDKLGLIIFPDNDNNVFYLDRDDIVYNVVRSAARASLRKTVLEQVLGLRELDLDGLTEELTKYLIENLKLLPPEFDKSCSKLISSLFKEES